MTNRNIAIYGNRILDSNADNYLYYLYYLYALDAETGRLAWGHADPRLPGESRQTPRV